jgi:hypothetical protein
MTDDQSKICESFETFLDPYLSEAARKRIAARYGEEIAAEVNAIYDDALNAPVDWRTADMNTALDVMHQLLNEKYPWLSAKARMKINYAFLMSWK